MYTRRRRGTHPCVEGCISNELVFRYMRTMFIFFFSFFGISFGTIARRDRYSFSCAFVTPSMCMNIALSLCFALYVLRAFYALSLFGYCVTASQRATSFVLPHSDIGPKRPCRVLVSAMLLPAIFTHVHKLGSIRLVHRNATIHVPRCLVNMTCMHECLDNCYICLLYTSDAADE